MRKTATLAEPTNGIQRLVIDECRDGVYLYRYESVTDKRCRFDHQYQTVAEAEEAATEFGVANDQWNLIADPTPGLPRDSLGE